MSAHPGVPGIAAVSGILNHRSTETAQMTQKVPWRTGMRLSLAMVAAYLFLQLP
jgi:hypothetical protein